MDRVIDYIIENTIRRYLNEEIGKEVADNTRVVQKPRVLPQNGILQQPKQTQSVGSRNISKPQMRPQQQQQVSTAQTEEPNDSNSVFIQDNVKPTSTNFTPQQRKEMKRCRTTPMPPDKVWGIVIHYTATDVQNPKIGIDDIKKEHRQRGYYQDIAYHFLIQRDGQILKGRDLNVENGGTKNEYWNDHTIAICYIGGCDSVNAPAVWNEKKGKRQLPGLDTRTPQQKASIVSLIKALKREFPTIADVRGHNQVPGSPTGCPGFDAHSEYQHLVGSDSNNPLYAKSK